jgi:hypothetical protein
MNPANWNGAAFIGLRLVTTMKSGGASMMAHEKKYRLSEQGWTGNLPFFRMKRYMTFSLSCLR